MRFLHAMVRVLDLEAAVSFFSLLGLREVRRTTSEAGRHTLVWLSTGHPDDTTRIELTHNWDEVEPYPTGRAFGHQFWFGTSRNIGPTLTRIAADLHIDLHTLDP